jgi:hypothetical protein
MALNMRVWNRYHSIIGLEKKYSVVHKEPEVF